MSDIQVHVYDKAKWHFDGDFPADLPPQQAYIHIGFFLGWLIERQAISDEFYEDWESEINSFRKREISAPRLLEMSDGALESSMIKEEFQPFLSDYYDSNTYFDDYETAICRGLPTSYHAANSWSNYEKALEVIDRRFAEFQSGKRWKS